MLRNTPQCNTGWKASSFILKDYDGKSHNLAEQSGGKGLLIAFICNHCPYVRAIADRLVDDAFELQMLGINVLAVMSNDYRRVPEDAPENMKQFSKRFGFTFPYLVDENQDVARAYGAVCTPDFFGFNSSGELQYRGRLDEARMGDASGCNRELVNAMKQIAETGKGPARQMASIGCSIKWIGSGS